MFVHGVEPSSTLPPALRYRRYPSAPAHEPHLAGMSLLDIPTCNGAQSALAIQSAVACDKAD